MEPIPNRTSAAIGPNRAHVTIGPNRVPETTSPDANSTPDLPEGPPPKDPGPSEATPARRRIPNPECGDPCPPRDPGPSAGTPENQNGCLVISKSRMSAAQLAWN